MSCSVIGRLDLTSCFTDYPANGINGFFNSAFPETEDVPPSILHDLGSSEVPLPITPEFRSPGFTVRTIELSHTVLRATMPKTSVNHDYQLLSGEGKVSTESLGYGPVKLVSHTQTMEVTS